MDESIFLVDCQTIHLTQSEVKVNKYPGFKTGDFKVLCTGSELEARDLPLCYEHFGACSRGELEGVRSLGNRGKEGKTHVPSILGSMASATGQTNLFPSTHVYYHTILSLVQTTKT